MNKITEVFFNNNVNIKSFLVNEYVTLLDFDKNSYPGKTTSLELIFENLKKLKTYDNPQNGFITYSNSTFYNGKKSFVFKETIGSNYDFNVYMVPSITTLDKNLNVICGDCKYIDFKSKFNPNGVYLDENDNVLKVFDNKDNENKNCFINMFFKTVDEEIYNNENINVNTLITSFNFKIHFLVNEFYLNFNYRIFSLHPRNRTINFIHKDETDCSKTITYQMLPNKDKILLEKLLSFYILNIQDTIVLVDDIDNAIFNTPDNFKNLLRAYKKISKEQNIQFILSGTDSDELSYVMHDFTKVYLRNKENHV